MKKLALLLLITISAYAYSLDVYSYGSVVLPTEWMGEDYDEEAVTFDTDVNVGVQHGCDFLIFAEAGHAASFYYSEPSTIGDGFYAATAGIGVTAPWDQEIKLRAGLWLYGVSVQYEHTIPVLNRGELPGGSGVISVLFDSRRTQ